MSETQVTTGPYTKFLKHFPGSIRARKLNILTLKDVEKIAYPLELEPVAKTPYFQKVDSTSHSEFHQKIQREQFSLLDQLKSPMVLMMMLPMVCLFLLPKLMDMQVSFSVCEYTEF